MHERLEFLLVLLSVHLCISKWIAFRRFMKVRSLSHQAAPIHCISYPLSVILHFTLYTHTCMIRFSLSWSIQLESDLGDANFHHFAKKHRQSQTGRPWLSPMASHCPQATLTTCLRKKKVSVFSKLWKKSLDLMVISGNDLSTNSCPKQTANCGEKNNADLEGWLGGLHATPGQMLDFSKASWDCQTKKNCPRFKLIFTESAEFQHKSGWLSHMAGHLAQGGRSPCLAGLI